MQEKYSPITQSRFENICSSHVILTQKVFLTLLSSVSAEDTNSTVIFVQSSSLFKILCKHSMHIHTVNIFYIYMYYIYIYLYRTWLSASYGSTVTHTHFVPKTKLDTKDNCTAFNFIRFFFFKECTTPST